MWRKFYLIIVFCFLLSCSPEYNKSNNLETITHPQIYDLLLAHDIYGADGHFFVDETFIVPTKEWFETVFKPRFWAFKNQMALDYGKKNNDCDDYTRMAAWFGAFIMGDRPIDLGVTIGEFAYKKEKITTSSGGGHAINIIIASDEGKYKILFYDPQVDNWVNLSRKEIQSCIFYRF